MSAPSLEPPEPEVFVIQAFVIETYPTMADVPYASVSEQRGKTPKTSENERFDELYGRCRTCMGHKSGEQLLLCDDCDRGFHMTCLVPVLRDVPKGEWHCPKCSRERLYSIHARAAAIVNLRKVLHDIQTRASLPLKVQLKYLDVAGPTVKCTRVTAPNHSTSQQQENTSKPISRRAWRSLPPKSRFKRELERKRLMVKHTPQPKDAESPVICKKIVQESVQKRKRNLSRLTDDLIPIRDRLKDPSLSDSLLRLQSRLKHTNERVDAGVAGTRTSHNALSRAKKKQRIETKVGLGMTCQCSGRCLCGTGTYATPPPNGMRLSRENKISRNSSCMEDPDNYRSTHVRA